MRFPAETGGEKNCVMRTQLLLMLLPVSSLIGSDTMYQPRLLPLVENSCADRLKVLRSSHWMFAVSAFLPIPQLQKNDKNQSTLSLVDGKIVSFPFSVMFSHCAAL